MKNFNLKGIEHEVDDPYIYGGDFIIKKYENIYLFQYAKTIIYFDEIKNKEDYLILTLKGERVGIYIYDTENFKNNFSLKL